MKTITFHFDFISPFAFLAFEKLPQTLAGLSYHLRYRPVLLGPLLRHHVSSVKIDLTGPDTASAASYFLVFTEVGLDHWGRYADRLVRAGGSWLIAHRKVRLDGAVHNSRMASGRRVSE